MTCAEYLKSWLDAIDGDEKFVMTVGAGIVNAIFFACGILSETGYLSILGGTVIAYIGAKTYLEKTSANVAQA